MVSKMVTDTQQGEVAVRDNRDEDEKAESFDLMTDCNVARIQEFLDAPFKRIGEAIQSVERRLEARGVTLTEELKRESNTREPLDAVEYACQSREKNNLDPEVFNWEITGPGTT